MGKRHANTQLQDWRCPRCDRLLQKHRLPKKEPYLIITVCPRCKITATLQHRPNDQAA